MLNLPTARSLSPLKVTISRNHDPSRDAVQREIPIDVHFVATAATRLRSDVRALKSNVRILVRVQYDLFQLFVDDLLFWLSEVSAGFVQRSSLDDKSQRRWRDRVGSKLDLSGEFARGQVMTLTLEPKQPAAIRVGHEFTLARVEIIGYRCRRRRECNGADECC